MTLQQQLDFLLSLGKRLDMWTSPGDSNDYLFPGEPLWDEKLKRHIPAPARVIDLVMARWTRIKDFQRQHPVGFLLNPAQRDFGKNRSGRDVVLKAGRAGFTTLLSQRGLLKTITRQGHTSLLVAHRQDSVQAYFTDVHFAFDHLMGTRGEEFRDGALRREKRNVRELYFPELNSRFFVETAGEFAPAEGEGFQYLVADEVARWTKGNPKQVLATLLSHVTGDATETYLISRPFGQSGEFYERYWAARRGESDFKAHFYQWWWNPGQRSEPPADFTPNEEERALMERYRAWRANAA